MNPSSLFAAAILALVAPAYGSLLTFQRFSNYYGYWTSPFRTNIISRDKFGSGYWQGAAWPSSAKVGLIESIDFPMQHYSTFKTMIFHGTIRVPPCRAGMYYFRVNRPFADAYDFFIDREIFMSSRAWNAGQDEQVAPGNATEPIPDPEDAPALQAFDTFQTSKVNITAGVDHELEFWWGSHNAQSGIRVEFCFSPFATHQARQAGVLSSQDGSPRLGDTDPLPEVADPSCVFIQDWSDILVEQDAPAIRRCDFTNNWPWPGSTPTQANMRADSCILETGGVIDFAPSTAANQVWSTEINMLIKPRVTGTHTFWLDTASAQLFVDQCAPDGPDPNSCPSKAVVVEAFHGHHHTQRGHIFLRQGETYRLSVLFRSLWSEDRAGLKVYWADTMSPEPQTSFSPILQPWTGSFHRAY